MSKIALIRPVKNLTAIILPEDLTLSVWRCFNGQETKNIKNIKRALEDFIANKIGLGNFMEGRESQ